MVATFSPVLAAGEGPGVTADQAIEFLEKGNARFIAGNQQHPNQDLNRRQLTASGGQHPFVTILSCSDSRVPVETLFDCGIGDIFVVRVAGNVAGLYETGSIEYAVDHLNTPLLVVLGHTQCGAVGAVVEEVSVHGNLPWLLQSIVPAVAKAKMKHRDAKKDYLLTECVKANVWQAIADIFRTSPTVCTRVKDGKLKVVGALYEVETGRVSWMGPHEEQQKFVSAGGSGKHQ
jgi:carbonic anhydrase